MAKTEWGLKRTCLSCGARFYDLNNKPIVCPKCEEVFSPEAATKLRRNRNAPVDVKKEKPKVDILETETDDLATTLDNSSDEDVLEDTSDLEDDDIVVAVPTEERSDDT